MVKKSSIAAVTFAAAALMGCQKETLKVALAGTLSGPDTATGSVTVHAAQIALDEWNAKGGVLGKQLEAVLIDDKGNVDSAVAQSFELAQRQDLLALIGHSTAKITNAVGDNYAGATFLHFAVASTAPKLTNNGAKTVFRLDGRDDFQGKVLGAYAFDSLKAQLVAVLYEKNNGAAKANVDAFKGAFEGKKGKTVVFQPIDSGVVVFKTEIDSLVKLKADAVYWGGSPAQGGPLYAALRKAGFKGALLGGTALNTPALAKAAPRIDSVFIPSKLPVYADSAAHKAFRDAYKAKFGIDATLPALEAYDAANILFGAIQKAGEKAGESVKSDSLAKFLVADSLGSAIRAGEWVTLGGKVKFDGKGDVVAPFYTVKRYKAPAKADSVKAPAKK